jgi:hypothetical protein
MQLEIDTSKVFSDFNFILLVQHVDLVRDSWLNHVSCGLQSPLTQQQNRVRQGVKKVVYRFGRSLSLCL